MRTKVETKQTPIDNEYSYAEILQEDGIYSYDGDKKIVVKKSAYGTLAFYIGTSTNRIEVINDAAWRDKKLKKIPGDRLTITFENEEE